MEEKETTKPFVLRLAQIATGVWVLLFIAICALRWDKLISSELHEIGDFLGGFFAPLAFFWFVITVFLQRRELQLTREEMILTRSELGRQSVAMEQALEIDRSNKMRDELARAIDEMPKRMSPLMAWCKNIRPVRNGITGEKLQEDFTREEVFKFRGSGYASGDPKDSFLHFISGSVGFWQREYRNDLGPIADTIDVQDADRGKREWDELRAWWAKHHHFARQLDDTSFDDAVISSGLGQLMEVAGYIFEPGFERVQ